MVGIERAAYISRWHGISRGSTYGVPGGFQGGKLRMSIKKKFAGFVLASVAMLGVSGCHHHDHYDDHHPPPPPVDHNH